MRNDMGVESGSVVPIDYDPMLGKLVVHAEDRPRAIARLARALDDYEIAGVETTLPLFRALVRNREFADAAFDVQWLDRRLAEGLIPEEPPSAEEIWLASASLASGSVAEGPAAPAATSAESTWRREARREGLR